MSRRNIDLHERGVAAINAREVPEDLLAPDFRMEDLVTAATDNAYHGALGWSEWMSDLFEEFADGARYEVEEIVADGEDFVVAMVRVVGRSAHSAKPLILHWASVMWFRDGLATRLAGYGTRERAVQAVGLDA